MYCYVYADGRVEWMVDNRQLMYDECRDVFWFYMLNGKLMYENLKGVNLIKEEENW